MFEIGALPRVRSALPVAIKPFSSLTARLALPRELVVGIGRHFCYYVAVKGYWVPPLSRSPDFTRVLVTFPMPARGNNPLAIAPLFGTPNP
jgi:hypothetical protein